MKHRAWLLLAAAGVWGCASDNSLGGSVSELFPLDISTAEVFRNNQALQVTYFRNRNVFLDVVVRVSVSLEGLELKPGTTIPMQGEASPGHQRSSVSHAPGGEPVRVLPNVKRGDFLVTSGGEPDQLTRGSFSMVFEESGGDLGAGRTLFGTFVGDAVDAGYGPLP